MINHGKQQSTISPEKLEINNSKVFISSNIRLININDEDFHPLNLYEFELLEYTKDEFIIIQSEQNTILETQIINLQLALCELYEGGLFNG